MPEQKKSFLDEIKAFLGLAEKAPVDPNAGVNLERPWDSEILQAPPPRPYPTPSPTPTPTTPSEDAFAMAERMARRRELAKKVLPQELWQ